ncbi:MAG: hypothetical protein R2706_08125 [Acidimicrobiales bacterium]
MSAPAAPTPTEPMRWYQPIIGLVFGCLVLGSIALATVVSYHDGEAPGADHGTPAAEDAGH